MPLLIAAMGRSNKNPLDLFWAEGWVDVRIGIPPDPADIGNHQLAGVFRPSETTQADGAIGARCAATGEKTDIPAVD